MRDFIRKKQTTAEEVCFGPCFTCSMRLVNKRNDGMIKHSHQWLESSHSQYY